LAKTVLLGVPPLDDMADMMSQASPWLLQASISVVRI